MRTEEVKKDSLHRNKGGRPKKSVKKDKVLTIKCSLVERMIIEGTAKISDLTTSEYLRQLGLNGKIDRKQKVLPPEVLQLTGTLNHLAANLNKIAKKRNTMDELNALERATLIDLIVDIDPITVTWTSSGTDGEVFVVLENIATGKQTKRIRGLASDGRIRFNADDYTHVQLIITLNTGKIPLKQWGIHT